MSAYDYDLFVIGGGSGSVRASRMAAATRVAIAEEYAFGRLRLALHRARQ